MEGKELVELEVGLVESSPFQTRSAFPEEGLEELSASIARQGVLQPILVRPKDGRYELIAGERRLRAAKIAGMTHIPAIVQDPTDLEAKVESLIENLQREELNEMDRARGILALKEAMGASWRQVAAVLGLTERRVMQLAQLTKLEEGVQAMIAEGVLPSRVGMVLAGLQQEQQREMAEMAHKEGWTSDELAERVRRGKEGGETRFIKQKYAELRKREVYPSVLYRVLDPFLNFMETSLNFARGITPGERRDVLGRIERLEKALGRFKAELTRV